MNITKSTGSTNIVPTKECSTLTAVFPDRTTARRAMDDLHAFGLRDDQISVAMRDSRQQDQLIADTGSRATEGAVNYTARNQVSGGLRGLFASFFPAKPQGTSVTPTDSSSKTPGGMLGVLLSLKIPEAEARQQETHFRNGSVLISANVFEDVAGARSIMQRHNGSWVQGASHSDES